MEDYFNKVWPNIGSNIKSYLAMYNNKEIYSMKKCKKILWPRQSLTINSLSNDHPPTPTIHTLFGHIQTTWKASFWHIGLN